MAELNTIKVAARKSQSPLSSPVVELERQLEFRKVFFNAAPEKSQCTRY